MNELVRIVFDITITSLFIISIYIDYKRIKAVKENTQVYERLEEKFIRMRDDMKFSIEKQEENTISFDELVEKVAENIKIDIDKTVSKCLT